MKELIEEGGLRKTKHNRRELWIEKKVQLEHIWGILVKCKLHVLHKDMSHASWMSSLLIL